MERNSSGALRAPGASGAAATFLNMRVCRRSVASHARLLARSGAAAFGRSTSGGAASESGRTRGASIPGYPSLTVGYPTEFQKGGIDIPPGVKMLGS